MARVVGGDEGRTGKMGIERLDCLRDASKKFSICDVEIGPSRERRETVFEKSLGTDRLRRIANPRTFLCTVKLRQSALECRVYEDCIYSRSRYAEIWWTNILSRGTNVKSNGTLSPITTEVVPSSPPSLHAYRSESFHLDS